MPKGWALAPLDDFFEPRTTRVMPGDFPDSPYVGLEQVQAQTGRLLGTVSASSMSSNAARFYSGDVLYGRMRPYLNKVLQPSFDGLASAEFIVLPTVKGIDNRFIRSRLSASDFVEFACSQYEGDRPRVKFDQLAKFNLALPPAAEQIRIVEKLEELLSDLDAGETELKAAQKKLTQYRQSLLKAAVEGALTASWREHQRAQHAPTETGAQLLQRILTARRARWETRQQAKFKSQGKAPPKDWQKKYPEPEQPDISELPELPQGWTWCCLDALIADGPQNGLYLPGDRYGRGTEILRIDDYQIGWHRDRADLRTVEADAEALLIYGLRAGDLVINRVNSMTHLGKSMLIDSALQGCLFESNMMRIGLTPLIDKRLLELYLGSDIGRARLTKSAKWAVNQASINQQDVCRTPVPLPPLDEQHELAECLESQLEAAIAMGTSLHQAERQSTAQRQNILRAAFSGQLVPQDPNDEPASELLARIRAQRATQAPARKPRGRRAQEAS